MTGAREILPIRFTYSKIEYLRPQGVFMVTQRTDGFGIMLIYLMLCLQSAVLFGQQLELWHLLEMQRIKARADHDGDTAQTA